MHVVVLIFFVSADKKSVWERHVHAIERALIIATPTVFGIVLLIIGLKQRKLSIAFNESMQSNFV